MSTIQNKVNPKSIVISKKNANTYVILIDNFLLILKEKQ